MDTDIDLCRDDGARPRYLSRYWEMDVLQATMWTTAVILTPFAAFHLFG